MPRAGSKLSEEWWKVHLLIMGPPGAGKGTQAGFLARWAEVPAISTGDILRANVVGGTELGIRARQYMDAGEYVPDSLTNAMVRSRISEPDAVAGFLLDGYPRTLAQVEELDDMLSARSCRLDAVVALTADTHDLVQRLLVRAGREGRTDDTAEVVRRRQEVYLEQTAPLLDVYRDRSLLVEVDGMGEIAQVTDRVVATVAAVTGR
jgi:adenylate kinase